MRPNAFGGTQNTKSHESTTTKRLDGWMDERSRSTGWEIHRQGLGRSNFSLYFWAGVYIIQGNQDFDGFRCLLKLISLSLICGPEKRRNFFLFNYYSESDLSLSLTHSLGLWGSLLWRQWREPIGMAKKTYDKLYEPPKSIWLMNGERPFEADEL